jgi:predicted nucleic acid-binding protein
VVSAAVFLDSGPLGLLSSPHTTPSPVACRQWAKRLQAASRRIIVPEITDYEVRRELLRANKPRSIVLLDALAQQLEYLALTTAAMRRAAELWAQARQQGQATAGDNTIDADMILTAQALTLGAPNVIIATTNVGHLSRFVPADLWQNIAP